MAATRCPNRRRHFRFAPIHHAPRRNRLCPRLTPVALRAVLLHHPIDTAPQGSSPTFPLEPTICFLPFATRPRGRTSSRVRSYEPVVTNGPHRTTTTPMTSRTLSLLYRRAHDRMRDVDGLLPQEAFDELLKFLFYKDCSEITRHSARFRNGTNYCANPSSIREVFAKGLAQHAPWARSLWPGSSFQVSDRTLDILQSLFADVHLTELPLDVRSTALSTFLTSDVRRSLGIYPTPVDVVRSMVEILSPSPADIIMDPACGTGTFLIETVRFITTRRSLPTPLTIYGVDKNPRMLLLADFNLGHTANLVFRKACADSLAQLHQPNATLADLGPNSVDVILTNPPFGVTVTRAPTNLSLFDTAPDRFPQGSNRIPSEVLFLERCLDLLRPGGRLAIILPRSVITNETIAKQRNRIDQIGHLTHVIDLPPETFASTGTQTTTVAAFFRKHPSEDAPKSVSVRVCHVTNVGFDTTGRRRPGSQLPTLPAQLTGPHPVGPPTVTEYPQVPTTQTLQQAAQLLFRRNGQRFGKALRDYVESANTGRTPGRHAYTDRGMFILKVGNLTGRGIDWQPRDRNFVSESESEKRLASQNLIVDIGDLLLTSSAHAARYIAKKVDVVARIPEQYRTVTFVGEMIRLRPANGVDPYVLLAALRHSSVRDDLQACVRGQTAHLNPNDLLEVRVPYDLRVPNRVLTEVAALLRREADLAFQVNCVGLRVAQLLDLTDTPPV